MANIGDTVRYLNATGGGVIRRIEGNVAYVEDEDGFETPSMLKELVVVLPAGHDGPKVKGAQLMFDQSAYDAGRTAAAKSAPETRPSKDLTPAPEPIPETSYGDKINLTLAFEPENVKEISSTRFSTVLVNDSNYTLHITFLCREDGEKQWRTAYHGIAPANEFLDLAVFGHEDLGTLSKVAIQYIPFKSDKAFDLKSPGSAEVKLDLTKFYKAHCFRPGRYFETPALEIPLVENDMAVRPAEADPVELRTAMLTDKRALRELKAKYAPAKKKRSEEKHVSPTTLLPLIEVDLHIHELVDTTAGMNNGDMLQLQLDTVRKTMKEHQQRKGQKIVFIHGKGEGVLRKEVLALLRREFPKASVQDASFREYGFGASLVTV